MIIGKHNLIYADIFADIFASGGLYHFNVFRSGEKFAFYSSPYANGEDRKTAVSNAKAVIEAELARNGMSAEGYWDEPTKTVHIDDLMLAMNAFQNDVRRSINLAFSDPREQTRIVQEAQGKFQAFCKKHNLPVDFTIKV